MAGGPQSRGPRDRRQRVTQPVQDASRNRLAALAYPLGAAGALVCLWRGRGDAFVRFHAWQSILLTVALVALETVVRVVPLVGRPLALFVFATLAGAALFLATRAYRGHWTALPLLGDLAFERVRPRP